MNKLKELRKGKRLTQQEMANILGITQNSYSYWENGKVKIDNFSLKKLSDFFNVSIDYILGMEETKPQIYDAETLELLEELRTRPEKKMLLSSSKYATKEDIEAVAKMFEKMNRED